MTTSSRNKLFKTGICLIMAIIPAYFSCGSQRTVTVDKFGFYEISMTASGRYQNPFTDLISEVELTRPNGKYWKIPLFWDGGATWKFRISPDIEGAWSWTINSDDRALRREKGSFVCKASSHKGTIEPMSGYPYHFQYGNGDRMWFMGETGWALFNDNAEEKLDCSGFEKFVTTRASQGFNVIHSMMLSEAGWGNSGGMPFIDMEKQIPNPGYWKEVDSRINFANQHGLIVGLVLGWGDKNTRVPYPWRLFPDIQARENYTRYIAARYSAYNVYFLIAGEWHAEIRTRPGSEDGIREEFIGLGNALDNADPHGRMIGIHPMNSNGSVREFNAASWMSFGDYQQNYRELHGRVLESMKFNKPVINSEYGYHLRDQDGDGVPDKDNSTSLESMRHSSWDIVMAGGYFVTGFGTTYFGGNRDPGPFNVDAEKNDDWERQIGYIKSFFEGLEYWKLRSCDSLLRCDVEREDDGRQLNRLAPPSKTYWLLAEPGRQYVIYVRGIDEKKSPKLEETSAGSFEVKFFNPRTGDIKTVTENIYLKGSFTWTPPDNNDWVVLILKRSD